MTLNVSQSKTPKESGLGFDRPRLPVCLSKSSSGNTVDTMDIPMRELRFNNDQTQDNITVVVTGPNSLNISFTLLPGELLDERLPEFTQITITASGAWRYLVRSGLID